MRKIILASHGSLAKGMKSAVKMITCDVDNILDYNLADYSYPEEIRDEIEKVVTSHPDTDFVICTDIKGGSVYNVLLKLCSYENVVLVSVMNLPVVIDLSLKLENEESSIDISDNSVLTALKTQEVFDKERLMKLFDTGKEDIEW